MSILSLKTFHRTAVLCECLGSSNAHCRTGQEVQANVGADWWVELAWRVTCTTPGGG